MAAQPIARLVNLSAPVGEDELTFWRRKALERAQCIAQLQDDIVALAERLNAVLEDGEA